MARLFATVSFQAPPHRVYDLQLDHWGICRTGNETFQSMRQRLESDTGPVSKWFESGRNAFYDNSIEGVSELHVQTIPTSSLVYYFSLSFSSTIPFPSNWPSWTNDAINSFPVTIVDFTRHVLRSIPLLNIGGIIEHIVDGLVHTTGWVVLSQLTSLRELVRWATEQIANRLLHEMDYNVVLPPPGEYLPRKDVMPLMLPTVYAMGGQDLTDKQKDILGPNVGNWYLNDGIVNTESMRGPDDSIVRSVDGFPASNPNSSEARGKYWHVGVNGQMDHADEIGIFIEQNTVSGSVSGTINNH